MERWSPGYLLYFEIWFFQIIVMKANIKSINLILLLFIFLSFVLALVNFFHFRSLWLDEASLALNIVNKPIKELLKPLDYDQVAPIGFLMVEKGFSSIFGNTDWSLRIFPLLLFFPSVYLMYKLALIIFREKSFALFAAAFFSLSYYPLYYSTEVKQYMGDVFISLIITISTLMFSKTDGKKYWVFYALIGIISVWFSNISVILLFSSGLYFLYQNRKKKQNYLGVIKVLGSWVISFFCYYILFVYNHPSQQYMVEYWSNANAFLPQNILSMEFILALYNKLIELIKLFHYRLFIIFILISILGFFFLLRKRIEILFIIIFPIILHLILSYLKLYPFHGRLIFYQYPFLILIFVSCFFLFYTLLRPKFQPLAIYLLVIPLLLNILNLFHNNNFPFEKEEIKQSLSQLNTDLEDGDKIYIYHSSIRPFTFYKAKYPKLAEMDNNNIIWGESNIENRPKDNDIFENNNGDIWILLSHIRSPKRQDEVKYIMDLFLQYDFEIVEEHKYKGSSVYKAVKND